MSVEPNRVSGSPRALASLGRDEARALRGLVFDLDDTLLDHGALTEIAYSALFRLREAGLRLVACTGRPAGWASVILRQWPIDAALAENGAVAFEKAASTGSGARRVTAVFPADADAQETSARRSVLRSLADELVTRFPDAALADDNVARLTDVTIDIGEHRRVGAEDVAAMREIARVHGVFTLASSVHLHLSFEDTDKAAGAFRLLAERFGETKEAAREGYAFIGDSGNDAAAFAAFVTTIGVANVAAWLSRLPVAPRYVTQAAMGLGFAELAARLLELRVPPDRTEVIRAER